MSSSTPRALVLLAPGAEEMEATIVIDVLRRGGVDTVLAGLDGPLPVVCSRGVKLMPDLGIEQVEGETFDAIVLPGGAGGAQRLADSSTVGDLLGQQVEAGRLVAAICAAPGALAAHGIGQGQAMTCHPSVRDTVAAHGTHRDDRVVEDGQLITSQGPGSAFEFALALVARLVGEDKAAQVAAPMCLPDLPSSRSVGESAESGTADSP